MRRHAGHQEKTDEELDFAARNNSSLSDLDHLTASLLGNEEAVPKLSSQLKHSRSLSSKLHSARSAKSVLDFHSFKPSVEQAPTKNYNWSCPNFGAATVSSRGDAFGSPGDDEFGGSMRNFDWSSPQATKKPTNPFLQRLSSGQPMRPSAPPVASALTAPSTPGNSGSRPGFASVLPLASGGSSALANFLSQNIGQHAIQEHTEEGLGMVDAMNSDDNSDALALESLGTMLAPDIDPAATRSESLQRLLEVDIMEAPITPQTPSAHSTMSAIPTMEATGDTATDSELFARLVLLTEDRLGDDDAFEPTPMSEKAV